LERLEREHENLRAALSWWLEQAESEGDRSSQEMALRLSTALWRFWDMRGHANEGRAFLERGEALCNEILMLSQELGDRDGVVHTLYLRGIIAGRRSDPATACTLLEEALALLREMDDKDGIAWALYFLTMQFGLKGDFARARSLCEECLTIQRELGNTRGIAYALYQLAVILKLTQGDPGVVRVLLEESLALAREIGDRRNMFLCFSLLAEVSLKQGDIISARSSAEQSLGFSKEIGDQGSIADALFLLGKVNFVQGDYTAARALYEESMSYSGMVHARSLRSLEKLAEVVAAQGELRWAAQLWGAAEAERENMGIPLAPDMRADYERSVAAACSQLGEKAFSAVWAEGRTMTAEQALAAQERTNENIT
jgi:tetratricopeptide (TPR) repeat protein